METTWAQFARRRLKRQTSQWVATAGVLTVYAGGILIGALAGTATASLIPAAQEGARVAAVILSTVAGFALALTATFACGAWFLRISSGARPIRDADLRLRLERAFLGAQVQPDFFSVSAEDAPSFGFNVLIAGFAGGRGWLAPGIFISERVLRQCPEDEIFAILSHERAHLEKRHLLLRCGGTFLVFIGSVVAASAFLLTLRMTGMGELSTRISPWAGLVPVLATWFAARQQLARHEIEADELAIARYGAKPIALHSALIRLARWTSRAPAPLVRERILRLERLHSETAPPLDRQAA